eukprot:829542-Pelagomonas_calceolata.AAC.1
MKSLESSRVMIKFWSWCMVYGVYMFTEARLHRAQEGVALCIFIKYGITLFPGFGGDTRCPHNNKECVDGFLYSWGLRILHGSADGTSLGTSGDGDGSGSSPRGGEVVVRLFASRMTPFLNQRSGCLPPA